MCPKGKAPAETLYAADISKLPIEEQLFFTSLQGIIAQKEPRIYLLRGQEDEFWQEWMIEKGYIKSFELMEPWKLYEKFKGEIPGAVITDSELLSTINVATMIAGIYRTAICTPEIAERAGLKVKFDLRNRWKTNAEAYGWAVKNLYPMLNRRILCSLHPHAAWFRMRDYLIQHQIFTFWIVGKNDKDQRGANQDEERKLIAEALKKWPENIPIIGFWYAGEGADGISEYGGLVLGGEQGKFTVCCDWATNVSVHSGIRVSPEVFKQKKRAPKLKLDKSKAYVMILQFESGDAPWYWEIHQHKNWREEARGTFPMGWCVGPATLDLLPDVLQWFYEKATQNDYFFCAMSGAGYLMPHCYATKVDDPEKVWREYMNLTARYMKLLDLEIVSLHTDAWHAEPQYEDGWMFKRYKEGIPGLKAILSDFGKLETLDPKRANHLACGIPVFHTRNRWLIEGDPVDYLVKQIREATPTDRPAFLSIMALSWKYNPTMIKAAVEKLGDDYVFVTPGQMAELFKTHTQK